MREGLEFHLNHQTTLTSDLVSISRTPAAGCRTFRIPNAGLVTVEGSKLRVEVPFPAVDLLYWRAYSDRIEISADFRELCKGSLRPDSAGILSMLIHGAPIPPLTLYREIRTFLPGCLTEIHLKTLSTARTSLVAWSPAAVEEADLGRTDRNAIVGQALESTIAERVGSASPVVLFSGGIDSTIMAAALKRCGYRDTTLVHLSFGEDHPDTIAAREVAQHLGLPFEVVFDDPGASDQVMNSVVDLYRQPFADHSSPPSHALAAKVARDHAGRPVLDGTGADGAFGLVNRSLRFRRLYRLPALAHTAADWTYRLGKLWRNDTFLERACRVLRRPAVVPKLNGAIAQNTLLGVAVRPTAEIAEVWESLETWIETIRPPDDPVSRIPLADLGVLCAGVFAHKNYSHFTDAGSSVIYPFLAFPMVDLALRRCRYWPTARQGKQVLKDVFGCDIPTGSLANRRKTGFVAEDRAMFASSTFLDRLEESVATDAPLAVMLEFDFFRDITRLIRSGRRLPANAYNLAWAVVMADTWLRETAHGYRGKAVRRPLVQSS
jgi:hypothetical protein